MKATPLLWIARIFALAIVAVLIVMTIGEPGDRALTLGEWAYLFFFPFGFSVGYLLGWRWPLLGGTISLVCMAVSIVVIGRIFGWEAYVMWAMLSAPGVLYVLEGRKLRATAKDES